MVKYRLKFKFEKTSASEDRQNNLNGILSDLDSIISDDPIRKPLDGEEIIMDGDEYKVVNTKISFERVGDVTYYDFVVLLRSKKIEYKTTSTKMDYDDYIKILGDKYNGDKYKKDKYRVDQWKYDNLKNPIK